MEDCIRNIRKSRNISKTRGICSWQQDPSSPRSGQPSNNTNLCISCQNQLPCNQILQNGNCAQRSRQPFFTPNISNGQINNGQAGFGQQHPQHMPGNYCAPSLCQPPQHTQFSDQIQTPPAFQPFSHKYEQMPSLSQNCNPQNGQMPPPNGFPQQPNSFSQQSGGHAQFPAVPFHNQHMNPRMATQNGGYQQPLPPLNHSLQSPYHQSGGSCWDTNGNSEKDKNSHNWDSSGNTTGGNNNYGLCEPKSPQGHNEWNVSSFQPEGMDTEANGNSFEKSRYSEMVIMNGGLNGQMNMFGTQKLPETSPPWGPRPPASSGYQSFTNGMQHDYGSSPQPSPWNQPTGDSINNVMPLCCRPD